MCEELGAAVALSLLHWPWGGTLVASWTLQKQTLHYALCIDAPRTCKMGLEPGLMNAVFESVQIKPS